MHARGRQRGAPARGADIESEITLSGNTGLFHFGLLPISRSISAEWLFVEDHPSVGDPSALCITDNWIKINGLYLIQQQVSQVGELLDQIA